MSDEFEPNATKLRIFEATKRLLADSDYDGLEVKAICQEASISRSTFYRYFYDKYEIAQWHFSLIAERYLYRTGYDLTFTEANLLNCIEVSRNKDFYVKAMASSGYQSPVATVRRELRQRIPAMLAEEHGVEITAELEFEIDAFVYVGTHMVARWAARGMQVTPQVITSWLGNLLPVELRRCLKSIHML